VKHGSCQKYTLQKLAQILQGNNVVDVPASNTDGFLQAIHLFFTLAE
jgi:hypothetical protein